MTDQPEGLSGEAYRQAVKRAAADLGRLRRNQRGRRNSDPYARAVPGGRIMPPRAEPDQQEVSDGTQGPGEVPHPPQAR